MSIVVETVSATATATSTTSLVVVKPAGVVVGNLLVVMLGGNHAGSSSTPTYNTLSGWTLGLNTNFNNRATNSTFFRVATSADVSASDYTFTATGSFGHLVGRMIRCSGNDTLAGGLGVTDISTGASGGTFTGTLSSYTPPVNGALVILQPGEYRNAGGASTPGAYNTITSGITFTEAYVNQVSGSNRASNVAVYGIQTTAAALTGYSNTWAGNTPTETYGQILVFNPPVNASGSNTLVTTNSAPFTQAGTCDTIGANVLTQGTGVALPQGGIGANPTVWTPQVKTATTWTPETK